MVRSVSDRFINCTFRSMTPCSNTRDDAAKIISTATKEVPVRALLSRIVLIRLPPKYQYKLAGALYCTVVQIAQPSRGVADVNNGMSTSGYQQQPSYARNNIVTYGFQESRQS